MMPPILRRATVTAALLALAACSASRPVLYPNARLNQGGAAVGRAAVEDCRRQADAARVDDGQAAEVAKSTGIGAAVGAATGAAVGAVLGNAGQGAAAGAAGGGSQGLIGGLFRSSGPSPLYKAYVDRCLRDQGYEVLGWK